MAATKNLAYLNFKIRNDRFPAQGSFPKFRSGRGSLVRRFRIKATVIVSGAAALDRYLPQPGAVMLRADPPTARGPKCPELSNEGVTL